MSLDIDSIMPGDSPNGDEDYSSTRAYRVKLIPGVLELYVVDTMFENIEHARDPTHGIDIHPYEGSGFAFPYAQITSVDIGDRWRKRLDRVVQKTPGPYGKIELGFFCGHFDDGGLYDFRIYPNFYPEEFLADQLAEGASIDRARWQEMQRYTTLKLGALAWGLKNDLYWLEDKKPDSDWEVEHLAKVIPGGQNFVRIAQYFQDVFGARIASDFFGLLRGTYGSSAELKIDNDALNETMQLRREGGKRFFSVSSTYSCPDGFEEPFLERMRIVSNDYRTVQVDEAAIEITVSAPNEESRIVLKRD